MQLGRTTHMPVPNSRRVMRTRSTAINGCGQKAVVVTVRSCGGCPGSFCHSERVWKCGADILSAGSGSILPPVPSPRASRHTGQGCPVNRQAGSLTHNCGADILSAGSGSILLPVPSLRASRNTGQGCPVNRQAGSLTHIFQTRSQSGSVDDSLQLPRMRARKTR